MGFRLSDRETSRTPRTIWIRTRYSGPKEKVVYSCTSKHKFDSYRKMISGNSSYYVELTNRNMSTTSVHMPTSNPSSKKISNLNKRNSQFVRLDFGSNLRVISKQSTSKQSTASIRKQSTLKSIKELPGEDKSLEIPKHLKISKLS
jgi:hypothetical protein